MVVSAATAGAEMTVRLAAGVVVSTSSDLRRRRAATVGESLGSLGFLSTTTSQPSSAGEVLSAVRSSAFCGADSMVIMAWAAFLAAFFAFCFFFLSALAFLALLWAVTV